MIKWDDSLLIGIKDIDDEHYRMIKEFSTLYEKTNQGEGYESYGNLLKFLDDYAKNHFAQEESFQRSINYPFVDVHIKYHNEFREKVKTLIAEHRDQAISNEDLIKLDLMVKDWLVNHIMTVDKELGEYYKGLSQE